MHKEWAGLTDAGEARAEVKAEIMQARCSKFGASITAEGEGGEE